MPPEDLIDSGVIVDRTPRNERLSRQLEPHFNLRRLVAHWHLIAPLG
jgi:hypothetical protein